MRTHEQIISDAGGTKAFADAIAAPANRVNQMKRSGNIPAPYWNAVARAKLSTLTELAAAAEKRRPEASSPEGCAA